uniref:Kinesin light chain n=1 Tax=Ditylum brightwellii TaxID=49249 RepID=A0A7S4RW18_9STRA
MKVEKQPKSSAFVENNDNHTDTSITEASTSTVIKVELKPDTIENLENLQGLTRTRNNMLQGAEKVLPKKYMNQFSSFSPDGILRQPVDNIDSLLSRCENVLPTFRDTLINIVEAAGLIPDEIVMWDGKEVMLTLETPYRCLTIGPLKSRERCEEKVANDYGGDYSRLVDIVRASIVVADEDQLISVAEALLKHAVRLKNRFKEPPFTGYCDSLFNIEIDGIICEVQLHASAIVAHKEDNHKYYCFFRSFFAGNIEASKKRIELLEKCIDHNANVQTALEEMLKSDDGEVIQDMFDLVNEMGDWFLCELLCRRLCELRPECLGCKNNLANVLDGQGKYVEAEMMHRLCWEAKKKELGEEHPDTLTSLHNMVLALGNQGNYAEAETLYQQCWEFRKKTLGEEHIDTLHTLNNIVEALIRQGEYAKAEVLSRQCWEVMKKTLGEDDPDTLRSLNNMALVVDNQGNLDEAERLHQQCWELRKRTLGEEHPDTLQSLQNVTYASFYQENYAKAESLSRQCWEAMKKTLGEEHPDTLAAFHNVAHTVSRQGNYANAEQLFRLCWEAMKKKLGEEHPVTLNTLNDMAVVIDDQGNHEKAVVLLQECCEARKKRLGEMHPDTRESQDALAKSLTNFSV